jgi:hypothetical protein
MYRTIAVVLVLVLAAGCGRKQVPAPNVGAGLSYLAPLVPEGTDLSPAPVSAPGTTYQGWTAPQWGRELLSENPATVASAGMALAELGEAGYPHLRAGLGSRAIVVRAASIQAMTKPLLLEHRKEMLPLLGRLLRDPEPLLRRAAAARLGWFGLDAQDCIADLQTVAAGDPMADIRMVAKASIDLILQANDTPTHGVGPNKLSGGGH